MEPGTRNCCRTAPQPGMLQGCFPLLHEGEGVGLGTPSCVSNPPVGGCRGAPGRRNRELRATQGSTARQAPSLHHSLYGRGSPLPPSHQGPFGLLGFSTGRGAGYSVQKFSSLAPLFWQHLPSMSAVRTPFHRGNTAGVALPAWVSPAVLATCIPQPWGTYC